MEACSCARTASSSPSVGICAAVILSWSMRYPYHCANCCPGKSEACQERGLLAPPAGCAGPPIAPLYGETCWFRDVMKPPYVPRAKRQSRAECEGLSQPERAELQRQGAKAAARGDQPSSNPMNEPPNLPHTTGEAAGTWRQRREAWQQGHDFQSRTGESADPAPGPKRTDDELE